MTAQTFLGIDAGGTHTDAVLCGPEGILAGAKAPTCHEDLPSSVRAALAALEKALEEKFGPEGPARLRAADRVTVGTTLAVNALVQGRADRVALALSAGPGLAPARFAIGDDVCILPGGLDHRGVEVTPLDTRPLADACAAWKKKGVRAVACVGKFSPRNAAHELAMADVVRAAGLTPVCGHSLSGELNFPRRIATAYYNAAVARIVDGFLTAVEQSLQAAGIRAPLRLLKADGGAVPAALARQEPVQSVLSGPAASVMGILALCPAVAEDACSVLLDVGGTTTDVALFVQGSPVVDRDGMSVRGRRTLVRSLASLSIGVGGDSLLGVEGQGAEARVHTGPLREGPAMAFGGTRPTLLDALNVCDRERPGSLSGDAAASLRGVAALAGEHGMEPEELAARAVDRHSGGADALPGRRQQPHQHGPDAQRPGGPARPARHRAGAGLAGGRSGGASARTSGRTAGPARGLSAPCAGGQCRGRGPDPAHRRSGSLCRQRPCPAARALAGTGRKIAACGHPGDREGTCRGPAGRAAGRP